MKAPILHIIRGLPEGFSEGLPYSYYMDVVRGEWSLRSEFMVSVCTVDRWRRAPYCSRFTRLLGVEAV